MKIQAKIPKNPLPNYKQEDLMWVVSHVLIALREAGDTVSFNEIKEYLGNPPADSSYQVTMNYLKSFVDIVYL